MAVRNSPQPAAFSIQQPFPVPSSEVLFVPIKTESAWTVSLELFDVLGRILQVQNHELQQGTTEVLSIETATLNTGFYFLRIQSGPDVQFLRFTVAR